MTKRKRTPLQILRAKEQRRRLVPAVVIQRRRQMRRVEDDPSFEILNKAKRYSSRHANTMHDLMLRTMGLTQTPEMVAAKFMAEGLDDVKLDHNAVYLMRNAINKVSEILIFKMVAGELVNDPKLRDRLVELFIDQRFDVMRYRPAEPATPSKPAAAAPADPLRAENERLLSLLSNIIGS